MSKSAQDAQGFVKGVLTHLKKASPQQAEAQKVQNLLFKMSEKAKHEHTATVTSAVKLNDAELSSIAESLSKAAGTQVAVENEINKDVLGGFRIQMADWVMDSTLRSQLTEMAHLLHS